MSGLAKEWVVFSSFFLVIAGLTIAEAFWLKRTGRASFGNSLGFSVITNLIGFTVGFFLFFIIFGVVLAMAWDGSLAKFPLKNYGVTATVIFAVLLVPAVLTVCKRLFLSILKIQAGKPAWLYSIASSVLSLTISLGVPILLGYFIPG